MDCSSSLALQILKSGSTATNLAGVLSLGHDDSDDNGLLQDLNLLLELFLESLDKLGFSTQSDLIGGLVSRFGAVRKF